MAYETDERIKNYLDTNQLHREQMCRAVLAIDKRFSDVRPRHPRGGPDGGRDIQAVYRDEQTVFGAVGFVNQGNDSDEQKRTIKNKFLDDLESALSADENLTAFVFFTNINLTIGEKDSLNKKAKEKGITFCDILDRERIRIVLDSPDGFSIRFQYLNLSLSEAEQASFFSRWGDDIQSVISSGFQKMEGTLNRVLFLQESNDPITSLTVSLELDRTYDADEIGHFRAFCYLTLKEPKHNILSILFGASDKSNRMRGDQEADFTEQNAGIKYGIGSGQWEQRLDFEGEKEVSSEGVDDQDGSEWETVGSGSSVGRKEVEFVPITYSKSSFIRFFPVISLKDLDDAMFLPFLNKTLAEKLKSIHIYSNGYKLLEIKSADICVDATDVEPNFPVAFSEGELEDQWVRVRPQGASTYAMRFSESTPKRLFSSSQVENSLENRKS